MHKADLHGLNLNLLVVLDALLENQSVSGAAQKLNLSQPAVSRSLGQLRKMFGDPLLVRASHGMLPTPRAEELAVPLAGALEAALELLAVKPFDPAETETIFRVATTDYGAVAALAPVLQRFLAEAPRAGLEIVPVTGDLFQDLAAGRLALALYADAEVPPSLRTRLLFEEDYVCLVRRDHPVARGGAEQIMMDDFLAWPHALITVFGGRQGVVDRVLEDRGAKRQVALWIPYFSVAPMMIQETDAILTLPARIARAYAELPSLSLLRPPLAIAGFSYRLLWHERTHKDPALAWLRQMIAEVLREW